MASIRWLNWPAPSGVKACYTLRTGGCSRAPYDSFNMGLHVGDKLINVRKNRRHLKTATDNLIDDDAILIHQVLSTD